MTLGQRGLSRVGGRFSTSFSQPLGAHVRPGKLWGYHIDFRVKAEAPDWPPETLPGRALDLWVNVAQWGLGCFERYAAGEGERWLEGAQVAGQWLVEHQTRGGLLDGAWFHQVPYHHTFPLPAPWLSGMAQGEAASLLSRLGAELDEEQLTDAAIRALGPLRVPSAQGGALATLEGGPFYEEYPTQPGSFVLNGAIFALFGVHDVATALDDATLRAEFEISVATLAAGLHRWDTGFWSRYDLFPHPVPNLASAAYHTLHITQLTALERLAAPEQVVAIRDRFVGYERSRLGLARALGAKVAFRMVVPRNELLARRLPWSRIK